MHKLITEDKKVHHLIFLNQKEVDGTQKKTNRGLRTVKWKLQNATS